MTQYRLDALEDLEEPCPDTYLDISLKRWTTLKIFELNDDIDTNHHLKKFSKMILEKVKRDRNILKAVVWEKGGKGRYNIQRMIL